MAWEKNITFHTVQHRAVILQAWSKVGQTKLHTKTGIIEEYSGIAILVKISQIRTELIIKLYTAYSRYCNVSMLYLLTWVRPERFEADHMKKKAKTGIYTPCRAKPPTRRGKKASTLVKLSCPHSSELCSSTVLLVTEDMLHKTVSANYNPSTTPQVCKILLNKTSLTFQNEPAGPL